jgi:hypothetical protein
VARIKEKESIREFDNFVTQNWGSGMGCIKCASFLDLFFDARFEFRHHSPGAATDQTGVQDWYIS